MKIFVEQVGVVIIFNKEDAKNYEKIRNAQYGDLTLFDQPAYKALGESHCCCQLAETL